MGEDIKFNWILKLNKKDLENLAENSDNIFHKKDKIVYPTERLIFLIDEEFNAKGIIKVEEFSIKDNGTSGKYKLIYTPNEEEKRVLSDIFKNMYLSGDF